MESDDENIFITQSKFCDNSPKSDEDLSGNFLLMYEDISSASENEATLSKKPIYEDISSASDEELMCTLVDSVDSDLRNKPGPSRLSKIVSDNKIEELSVRSLADSTKKKIKWAYNLFNTWKTQRNAIAVADLRLNISIISSELEDMTKEQLCFAISRFICEIKKENGEEYPGQTLYEILINLQLYLEGKGKYFKFLNEDCFIQIKNTLDHTMKERAKAGLGTHKKKAQQISYDEENMLWEKGILGNSTPQKLLDTTIYLFGLNFALRAGKEHRDLRIENSQISEHTDINGDSYLVYREDVSKSNQGGLKSRKCKQKVVFAYENKENPERCIVKFYRDYISHCPDKKPKNAFYLKPLSKPTGQVWFASMPVGINMLTATIARLCKEAGLKGFRSNHSLRATAATRLYEDGQDEQLISEITGHKSNAVREYKRTNTEMKRKANQTINSKPSEQKKPRSELQINSAPSTFQVDGNNINITLQVNFGNSK